MLLFRLCEWHALAKLRLHSDDSLTPLDQALGKLAGQIRKFQRITCSAFQTKELPSEATARQRREKGNASFHQAGSATTNDGGLRPKAFGTLTYKFHALGDYTSTIRQLGTADSYTTQLVRQYSSTCAMGGFTLFQGELARCLIKKFYARTNKKDAVAGITRQERRFARIRRQLEDQGESLAASDLSPSGIEALAEMHHVMSKRGGNAINLPMLLKDHSDDPATKVWLKRCRLYLFPHAM